MTKKKPCQYCRPSGEVYYKEHYNETWRAHIRSNLLTIYTFPGFWYDNNGEGHSEHRAARAHMLIKYCPFCGRKLDDKE